MVFVVCVMMVASRITSVRVSFQYIYFLLMSFTKKHCYIMTYDPEKKVRINVSI